MPTDAHSQAHTGTYGLFDDPDEFAQATSRFKVRSDDKNAAIDV
jgi:hypothetical protein